MLVCLQTCQVTAVPGAAEEAGAFRTRQHKTHHTELAEKGQDAHQGIRIKTLPRNKDKKYETWGGGVISTSYKKNMLVITVMSRKPVFKYSL